MYTCWYKGLANFANPLESTLDFHEPFRERRVPILLAMPKPSEAIPAVGFRKTHW